MNWQIAKDLSSEFASCHQKTENAQKLTFPRTRAPPRTVWKISAGPLPLLNIEYPVTDAELAVEDLHIGLPVLEHLPVDKKTFLEERRNLLDGSDCAKKYYQEIVITLVGL